MSVGALHTTQPGRQEMKRKMCLVGGRVWARDQFFGQQDPPETTHTPPHPRNSPRGPPRQTTQAVWARARIGLLAA
jgi:hypothetical protein